MRYLKQVVAACLALLLMVQATGCMSWQVVMQPVPDAVAQNPNRRLQVSLQDGRTIDADSATAGAEALVAYQGASADTIPLAQVKSVRVRRLHAARTVWLVVVLGAVVFVGVMANKLGGLGDS